MSVVAGIGCRKGADAAAVMGAVDAALAAAGLSRAALRALVTSAAKAAEPGIREAARSLSLPLLTPPDAALRETEPRTLTRSAASKAATGLSSLSEAAALAAAGAGGKLLGRRVAFGPATCALAGPEEALAHHDTPPHPALSPWGRGQGEGDIPVRAEEAGGS